MMRMIMVTTCQIGDNMLRLSYYLGRKVKLTLTNGYIVHGYFEQYEDKQYYIVLRDGSRIYFRPHTIKTIYIE